MTRKMLISFLIIFLICPSLVYSAQTDDKDKKSKKEETKGTKEVKRLYTEEEFRKAVYAEVDLALQKVGQGKLSQFSIELIKKEERLKLKALDLKRREEQLKISTEGFNKKIKDFQDRQKNLLGCIDGQQKKKDDRIRHMVDVVSNMRPQIAAEVLSVQDADIAVKILGRLESDKVAKIFNAMDKEISARLQKQYMTMKK